MRNASGIVGPPCPADAAHGPLLAAKDGTGWVCVHIAHFGRPKSHPLGAAPETRAKFTTAEVAW